MAHIIVLGLISCQVKPVKTEASGILVVVDRESYVHITHIGHIKHRGKFFGLHFLGKIRPEWKPGVSLPVLEYLDLGYIVMIKIIRVPLYEAALCFVGHKTH